MSSRAVHVYLYDVVANANEGLLGRGQALFKVSQSNRPTDRYLNPGVQHGLARP